MTSRILPLGSCDQAGQIFLGDTSVFRVISAEVISSLTSVLSVLTEEDFSNRVVKSSWCEQSQVPREIDAESGAAVLCHEKIPTITYPHEWTPGMLQRAACFHLRLSNDLLAHGLYIKDAHPWNILYRYTKPVFVDIPSLCSYESLSKEVYLEANSAGEFETQQRHLVALTAEIYERMFLPYFLYPLYALTENSTRFVFDVLKSMALNTVERTPVLDDYFPQKEKSGNINSLLKSYQDLANTLRVDEDLSAFFTKLENQISNLRLPLAESGYVSYYKSKGDDVSLNDQTTWNGKQRAVAAAVRSNEAGETLLDLGCNTGWYSRLAVSLGKRVVSADIDVACVDVLFNESDTTGDSLVPIVAALPLHDERVASVYDGKPLLLSAVERLQCDTVLALALVHHLVLGLGVSLEEALGQLERLSRKQLVLEFVPKDDPLIQAEPEFFPAYAKQQEGFTEYSLENVEKVLGRWFSEIEVRESTPAHRKILIARKKRSLHGRQVHRRLV